MGTFGITFAAALVRREIGVQKTQEERRRTETRAVEVRMMNE
jgi:hypothetical protein